MSDRQKGDVVYYIESSCHAMIGQTHDVPDDQRLYDLVTCDLVVPNMEAWRLKWDFELLKEVYEHNPQTSIGASSSHHIILSPTLSISNLRLTPHQDNDVYMLQTKR